MTPPRVQTGWEHLTNDELERAYANTNAVLALVVNDARMEDGAELAQIALAVTKLRGSLITEQIRRADRAQG